MAVASAQIDVRLNFMPLLDQLGVVELVAKMRREEWIRGQRDARYREFIPEWDDIGDEQLSWIATAREKLEEGVNV